ncbi:MAG: putative cytosolic protein [Holophagaceae bacterium]|nr:putative cytosolic protein [Holophagaceae bacterium]
MTKDRSLSIRPIGVIRTPHKDQEKTPIQPCFAREIRGEVHLNPSLMEGLKGIEGFSHLHLIYHLHQAEPGPLVVKPFLIDEPTGIFACRYPERPNAIGLSVVRLLGVEGCRLVVEDVDMLDGSPLLDIKPYYPKSDRPEGAWGGWTECISPQEAQRRGKRGLTHV